MNPTSQVNIADFAKRVSVEVILNMPYSEHYNLAYKRNDGNGMPWVEMFNTEANTGLIMNYAEYIKEIDEYEAEHGRLDDEEDSYDYDVKYDDYIGDNTLDEIDADDGDIGTDPLLGRRGLEYPYTEMNSFGRVRIDERNGRRQIIIRNKITKKTFTTSYGRYVMSVEEGRFLRADEHVDHKDEDKTNDDISNLQILSPEENLLKNMMHRGVKPQIDVFIDCPNCSKTFIRRYSEDEYDEILRKGKKICCSLSCATKYRYNHPEETGFKLEEIETRICPNCDHEFDRPAWYFRGLEKAGVKNSCCSRNCANKYRGEKTEMETRVCPHCNKEFTKSASYFRQQEKAGIKNTCCSDSCRKEFYKEKMETRLCPQCDNEFTRPASWFRAREKAGIKNPCCSMSCGMKYYYSKK